MAQAASSAHLEWPPGQRHPVRHERVKLALHQAAEFGAQIDKVRCGLGPKGWESWGLERGRSRPGAGWR